MPAKSKSQQKFMALVLQYKRGELPNASQAVKDAAEGMTEKEVEDFASTKTKNLPDKVEEKKDRDYKEEYRKYGSSKKAKKYRAELNKYNRQKGTYGNGDGKDASHKGGKIVGFESESKNRGRREKSRLKKESKMGDKLTQSDIRKGMMIDRWKVIKFTPKRVTVVLVSERDLGYKISGRPLTFQWDGTGYKRQGQYLRKDGISESVSKIRQMVREELQSILNEDKGVLVQIFNDLDKRFGKMNFNKVATFNKMVTYLSRKKIPHRVAGDMATEFTNYKVGHKSMEQAAKDLDKILKRK